MTDVFLFILLDTLMDSYSFLYSLKIYPVELLLEFFICIIYTELLKTVPGKCLKPATKEKNKTQLLKHVMYHLLRAMWNVRTHP